MKSLSCVWLLATHGLQPTRLLRPWDFPGKSTGVGCHCLLRQKYPPSPKVQAQTKACQSRKLSFGFSYRAYLALSQGKQKRVSVQLYVLSLNWLCRSGSRICGQPAPCSCSWSHSWAHYSRLIIGVRSTLKFATCNRIGFCLLRELFLNNFPFKPAVMRPYKLLQSCPTLCGPVDHSLPGFPVHGIFPGKNTGVGCHFLPQGSSRPRDQTCVSYVHLQYHAGSLPLAPRGQPSEALVAISIKGIHPGDISTQDSSLDHSESIDKEGISMLLCLLRGKGRKIQEYQLYIYIYIHIYIHINKQISWSLICAFFFLKRAYAPFSKKKKKHAHIFKYMTIYVCVSSTTLHSSIVVV